MLQFPPLKSIHGSVVACQPRMSSKPVLETWDACYFLLHLHVLIHYFPQL